MSPLQPPPDPVQRGGYVPPPYNSGIANGRPWGLYVGLGSWLVALPLLVMTALAAVRSESAGVTMSYVAVGPVAFALITSIVGGISGDREKVSARVALPIGCGCASALGSLLLAVLFFEVVFPML